MQRYTDLGTRLTELLGSQTRIATVLGTDQGTVSKKLTGQTAITLQDLERVKEYLQIPMTAFFELKGTDGAMLRTFHEMHMRNPEALDRVINAYRHHPKILSMLAERADELVTEIEPQVRRGDRIAAIGVADNDTAIPSLFTEEEFDESEDDSEAHFGIDSDEGGGS